MSVRTRLLLAMGGIAVVLVVPALHGLQQLREVQRIARTLEGRHAAAQVALGDLQSLLDRADRLQRAYVALGEPSAREGLEAAVDSAGGAVERLREAGYGDGARRLTDRLTEVRESSGEVHDLVESGETRAATARFDQFVAAVSAVRAAARAVAAEIDRRSTAAAERAGRIARRATLTTAGGVAAGLLMAVLLGLLITRSLTSPLARLRVATESLAEGEFREEADLATQRDDELGAVSRAFASMQERLAELNELRAELLGATSHRLKTPVSVIQGYLEMLEDGTADALGEEERAYLAAMKEQVTDLRERVDRLMELSRVESEELDVAPEPVPVRPLFGEVQRTFEPLAGQQQIMFSVEMDDDMPHTVEADPDRLRDDLVGNLVENALSATEPGGTVRVRVTPEMSEPGCGEPDDMPAGGDAEESGARESGTADGKGERTVERWSIEVSDTGSGIPQQELHRIFDRYYQVGEGTGGIGLGLAVARSVVQAHGGEIEAASEEGEGSTFRVVLPVS